MKQLILLTLFALAPLTKAQTTNVTFSILVEEPTRTNTMIVLASSKEVKGLSVNWEKDISLVVQSNAVLIALGQPTNATPSFRKSAQDWQKAHLATLQPIADADERSKGKVDALLTTIGANWDALSGAQKQALKDMAASLGL